jgi:hypothetical protein
MRVDGRAGHSLQHLSKSDTNSSRNLELGLVMLNPCKIRFLDVRLPFRPSSTLVEQMSEVHA